MSKNYLIINEQHSLTQEQVEILNKNFESYDFFKVKAEGFTLEEMQEIKFEEDANIIFVSPVPYLLGKFSKLQYNVYLFHNDKRDKKELPNGKVVYTIANTGWQLIKI